MAAIDLDPSIHAPHAPCLDWFFLHCVDTSLEQQREEMSMLLPQPSSRHTSLRMFAAL